MLVIGKSIEMQLTGIQIMKKLKALFFHVVTVHLLLLAVFTQAQNRYPDKPVNIIVPFAPGGGNDLVSRLIS